jgi:UDP-2,4-diacetamido-2,4,6-trideoxy-beta-L-altropyranose hydrolase
VKIKIILRADGNATIGLGHVYRLLALADMLRDDFQIVFAIAKPDEFLKSTIGQYAHEIIELPVTFAYKPPSEKLPGEEMPIDLAPYLTGNEIVVTDGYWFGTEYQKVVKKTGAKLVCVDDFAENYFYADAMINHAPGLIQSQYRSEPYTKFFLGLDYALLRKDFFKPFPNNRTKQSLIIGLGSSDTYEITGKILNATMHSDFFSEIHVMIATLFSEKSRQQLLDISSNSPNKIFLHQNLNASELVSLMDTCEYAAVSASTMLLECYSRGLICFTGYYTANQLNIYNGFTNQNFAYGWGDFNNFNVHVINSEIENHAKNQSVSPTRQPLNSVINIQKLFLELC